MFRLLILAFLALSLHADSMIVLLDGSGENYNCDEIRKSNFSQIETKLSKEYLKKHKIKKIYFGLFSRNAEFKSFVSTDRYRRKRDDVKYKMLSKAAKKGFENIKKCQIDFYTGKEGGKKIKYGKDIKGALLSVKQLIQEQNLKKEGNVQVIIASDMWQSVNKDEVKASLRRNHIKFASNVELIIFGKILSCENSMSQSQKIEFANQVRDFWLNVIEVENNGLTFLSGY